MSHIQTWCGVSSSVVSRRYECVMSHLCMSRITWVTTHRWMSHDTHMNESWRAYECVMSRQTCSSSVSRRCRSGSCAFISVTWLIHTCDMTHLYVWHDSFIRVTWLIHMWWNASLVTAYFFTWHDPFMNVIWSVHIWWHAEHLQHLGGGGGRVYEW